MSKRRIVISILHRLPGIGKWEELKTFERNEVAAVSLMYESLKRDNPHDSYRVIQRRAREDE